MFLLTEMAAFPAASWAIRAGLALAKAGFVISDDVVKRGWESLAVAGFNALAGMQYAELKPLLDEMVDCVQIIRDHKKSDFAQPLMENDIEEVMTVFRLYREVWDLHASFLLAAMKSKQTSTSETSEAAPVSQNTRTSHQRSAP
jgi:hypothetical protein